MHAAATVARAVLLVGLRFLISSALLLPIGIAIGRLAGCLDARARCLALRTTLVLVLLSPLTGALLSAAGVSVPLFELPRTDVRPALASAPGSAPSWAAAPGPGVRAAARHAPGGHTLLAWTYVFAAGVMLLGSALLGLRLGALQCYAALLRRRAGAAPDALVRRCAVAAGFFGVGPPPLLISPGVASPMLVGVRRSVILLPEGAVWDEAAASEGVMMHELAHAQRRDCAWNLASRLLCALAWWQPLVWALAGELEAAAEECCDDRVVYLTGNPALYARHLVEMAARYWPRPGDELLGMAVVTFRSGLGRRIKRILAPGRALERRVQATAAAAVVAALVLAALATGALQVGDGATKADRPAVARLLGAPDASVARSAALW